MKLIIDIDEAIYKEIKEEVKAKVNTSSHIPFLHEVICVGEPLKKRPQGEWITRHKVNSFGQDVVCFECNKCGEYKVPLYHLMITEPLKVCPNCGIDMKTENE